MAIAFVKSRYVSRSNGGNACRSSAYNARIKIVDEKTGEVFDFSNKQDLAHHEVLLPEYVKKKFLDVTYLSNAVEHVENQKNSQLYIEWVLALPKEEEITLEMKKELVQRFIEYKGWVKEGLGVQIDIHAPHEDSSNNKANDKHLTEEEVEQKELNNNWHAHLLFTTRRFRKEGEGFERLKARDLQPEVRHGKVVEETEDSIAWTSLQNEFFKEQGLALRVDLPGKVAQKHIGPVRMRNPLNWKIGYNGGVKEINANSLGSGLDVLDKVTANISVFSRSDLQRAVKILPDKEMREVLVEDAMASRELLVLYDENGRESGFYTTKEVRSEEQRLFRLSSYVAKFENAFNKMNFKKGVNSVFNSHKEGLTSEQQEALWELLKNDYGIRILRGRAGSGKSEVLGKFASIANDMGINVMGLAPTHKAKLELQARGYEEVDTIKGLLFKYRNGRAFVPKGAVLVVDEAGMVGNDESSRVPYLAASRKCIRIVAGDEWELASIGRGGMFEVFGEKYGSSLISDIRRQKQEWAKSVAMAFSNGEVRSGIEVLEEHGKILRNSTAEESINALVQDWDKSNEKLEHKLIIAVKNADVDLINESVRACLIKQGRVSSGGFRIKGKTYAKGDRVIIKETNKDLGFTNGDFGIIDRLDKELCIIRFDGDGEDGRKIEFDPRKYQGFGHGYASTVYKSQGASILEVYVYHNGYSGIRNAYVALSRCINDMRLYINDEFTRGQEHLIKQLGHDAEVGSSLSYMVKEEYERLQEDELKSKTSWGKIGKWIRVKATEIGDKWSSNSEYYEYEGHAIVHSKVEEVLEQVAAVTGVDEAKVSIAENDREVAIAVGAENIRLKDVGMVRIENASSTSKNVVYKNKPSQKERFYNQVERSRNKLQDRNLRDYSQEMALLKGAIEHNSDRIVRDLLGEPNKKLSRGAVYRYGSKGSLAVHVRGSKAGTWYDFEVGQGGDIFSLVSRERGGDFKESSEYLKDMFGVARIKTLRLVENNEFQEKYAKHIEAQQEIAKEEKRKAEMVEKLYNRAKEIKENSIANRYLKDVRKINLTALIGEDIKTAGIYYKKDGEEKGKYIPALIAFAKDANGKVTGGQQILLDKKTAQKADIDVPKKSFGRIAGSFVNVCNINNREKGEKITIIAEGVETALSISQAFEKEEVNLKILCSLGVGNIKNYPAKEGDKIIIASDNDVSEVSKKVVANAKKELEEEKGGFVEVVSPKEKGDFNDVLQKYGTNQIREDFKEAIDKHRAKTVEEYFSGTNLEDVLSKQSIEDLKYIQKYNLSEEEIVNNFRKSCLDGRIKLDYARKKLMMLEDSLAIGDDVSKKGANVNNLTDQHKLFLGELRQWSDKINYDKLLDALANFESADSLEYIRDIRNVAMENAIEVKLKEFSVKKSKSSNLLELKPVVAAEQKFLRELYNNSLKENGDYSFELNRILISAKRIDKDPKKLELVFNEAEKLVKEGIEHEFKLVNSIGKMLMLEQMVQELEQKREFYIGNYMIPQMKEARYSAKTLGELLTVRRKEQEYLSLYHGNLKYLDFDSNLMKQIEIAHTNKQKGVMDSLELLVNKHLTNGISSKEELVKKIKETDNINTIYHKLDKVLEVHEIKKNLNKLDQKLTTASTIEGVLKAIGQKQGFISSYENNLKYKDHGTELIEKLRQANENNKSFKIEQLHKIVNVHINEGITKPEEIIKILKSSTGISGVVRVSSVLISSYQDHSIKELQRCFKVIDRGKEVKMHGESFSCQTKFLEYVLEFHKHNEFLPRKIIETAHTKLFEHRLEKDYGMSM